MKSFLALLCASLWLLVPGAMYAQETPDPCPNPGTFGCFEVGLPGNPQLAAGQTIDTFVNQGEPILTFINVAVKVVIAIVVIIAVISIVVAGYVYMTAGGNANQVGTAKEIIKAALFGIVIALTSVIILNTINTFLGSGAKEPELGSGTGGGAGEAGGNSPTSPNTTNGNNAPGGELPNSNPAPNNNDPNAEPEAESSNPPNPLPSPSSNNPTTGTPFTPGLENPSASPKTVSVTIIEHSYYIDGAPVPLSDVLALAEKTTGDETTGLRVHIYQDPSSRVTAENTLIQGLNGLGIDNDSMLIHPPQQQ